MNKLYVIGIDPRCPDEKVREIISSCDVVIASKKHMDRVKGAGLRVKGFVSISPLKDALDFIKENLKRKKIAVLASGDPLFFGIGRRLLKEFGKEQVEFIPAVSSMQTAFARIKEPWQDAVFVSVHGRKVEDIVETVKKNNKIGIFTDKINSPARIARTLLQEGLSHYRAYICEDLGYPGEKITSISISEMIHMNFSPLNIIILINQKTYNPPLTTHNFSLGIPDEEFAHSKGLITKEEIRVLVLSKLRLRDDGSIFWDIGAGCGSVSIEAARIAGSGEIYAVERDEERAELIRANLNKFGILNVCLVTGEAPDALNTLPSPDIIFIGGSGGKLKEILEVCRERLKEDGRMVINAITMETLSQVETFLREIGFDFEVLCLNISRTRVISQKHLFYALNPVYIISTKKR